MCSRTRALGEPSLPNISDIGIVLEFARVEISHCFAKKVVLCGKERDKSTVWSWWETLRDKYVTFLARPGSCLATLVLQEIQDCICT
jgi:hypothetical protein